MEFEEWFKKTFPEHKSGYLYGKKAIEVAFNAGKEIGKKEKLEKESEDGKTPVL